MSDELTPEGGEVAPAPEPSQAEILYDGLQNLDTRAERLGELLRPGQDLPPGMDWNTARSLLFAQSVQQEEPEEFDPIGEVYGEQQPGFLGYDPDTGQPVYEQQYQQPGFDPRSLTPVFESYGEQIKREAVEQIRNEMMQQAQEQGISMGVTEATQKHGLNDYDKRVVEMLTRDAVRNQPHRAPADLANEIAKQHLESTAQRFVNNGGVPPVQGAAAPGGPIPGESVPQTFKEMQERLTSEWGSR